MRDDGASDNREEARGRLEACIEKGVAKRCASKIISPRNPTRIVALFRQHNTADFELCVTP